MTYAKNRKLRERLYKAHIKRASEGEQNNQPLIKEILTLRKEQARALGYENWANLSLASKMASNTSAVEKLLEELRIAALPKAQQEIKELTHLARESSGQVNLEIKPWDVSFWSEKLRQKRPTLLPSLAWVKANPVEVAQHFAAPSLNRPYY